MEGLIIFFFFKLIKWLRSIVKVLLGKKNNVTQMGRTTFHKKNRIKEEII